MKEEAPSKDENFWKILSSALELDVKKGHMKWTMSDLSRKSGITRSLIYYYFGRSKIEIVTEAIKMMGHELTGEADDRVALWKNGDLLESVTKARKIYDLAPYLAPFVYQHRALPTDIGEGIRQVELGFKHKLEQFFPKAKGHEVHALFVVYWGMIFAPDVTPEVLEKIMEVVQSYR